MRFDSRLALAACAALISPMTLYPRPSQSGRKPAVARSAASTVHFKNAAPGVAFVGSKACAECHGDINDAFLKTDMGHTMSLPNEWKGLQALEAPVKVKLPNSNRCYEVYYRDSKLLQAEYELDADGKEVFRDEQEIAYIMGSGANGFTCIVRRGNYLFEAPLSYYAKTQSWALSPGYEQADLSFSRPIEGDCIFCHSGLPRPVENVAGKFNDPPFVEMPIGCESCHGPGALHVAERKKVAPLTGKVDLSIVNPAKLPGWLGDEICMYCHQGLDARALLPGKGYADYRPGKPLADTMAIFTMPIVRGEPAGDPLLQHFIPKSLSQCYLKTGGKLNCITCHDPHRQPSAEEAPAYFRSKCLTCHTDKSCTLPLETRMANTPPNDCAGCHMAKQSVLAISHSSLTDHRILARPGEPLPEAAYHMTSPQFPDLVYVDAAPHAPPKPLPPLTMFRAYSQLVQLNGKYVPDFDAVMDSLAKSKSEDPAFLSVLALKKLNEGTAESEAEAAQDFDLAIRGGSATPQNFELLATLQTKAGKTPEAIKTVQQGLEVNPYSDRLYRLLAAFYVSVNDYDDAIKTMKKALELFPEDSFLRSLLEKTENAASQGGSNP